MEIRDSFWCGVLEFGGWFFVCFLLIMLGHWMMMFVAPLKFNMGPWCLSEPRVGFLHVVWVWSVPVHLTFF